MCLKEVTVIDWVWISIYFYLSHTDFFQNTFFGFLALNKSFQPLNTSTFILSEVLKQKECIHINVISFLIDKSARLEEDECFLIILPI